MRNAVRRLATATGVLVAAGALPIVVSAPAQAATKQCETFLADAGYKIGPKVHSACRSAGEGNPIVRTSMQPYCTLHLRTLGVKVAIADAACWRAVRL